MTTHTPHEVASVADDVTEALILDGAKIQWHMDRVEAWERGERIAPITIDMALTRACNYACGFCYAMLQENDRSNISKDDMTSFLEDSAEMGVRAISLVSDGESTLHPAFAHTINYGHALGIDMAVGTNGWILTPDRADEVLSALTYLRFNVSAGTPKRYAEIMGVPADGGHFDQVMENARHMVAEKKRLGLGVTIGFQMVLMPQDGDQIIPFAELCRDVGVDYGVIKHCSDDEEGRIGVDYSGYARLTEALETAEAMSTPQPQISAKWSKIGNPDRTYSRCYGPPFIIQMSGSGLIAPCGMLFNSRYAPFHIGNITEDRWGDIWRSDRYWDVMNELAGENFDARRMCGTLCLQHVTNTALDNHRKGIAPLAQPDGVVQHMNFI